MAEISANSFYQTRRGRCGMKQYVPNKPIPVGLENFVLAEKDGVIYDIGIYKGRQTFPDMGLGVAGNSVLL
ncbi:hypothetical protein HPB47_015968 [Ixodes persulcatus]|uniref:Uncharacterized protein n=1 Tax=Ixodes persulcatus TaxID=34615 RepID=A0AC60R1C6_IXOPE|nr:hypothetical protein HPB47_015968 [Ixodes persulcatus]